MRVYPIDTARTGQFQFIQAMAKRGEGGEQATTNDGLPRWVVQVLVTPLPVAGFEPKATLEEINIADRYAPDLMPMSDVDFPGLVARPWSMNGRSGISLSAEGVQQLA